MRSTPITIRLTYARNLPPHLNKAHADHVTIFIHLNYVSDAYHVYSEWVGRQITHHFEHRMMIAQDFHLRTYEFTPGVTIPPLPYTPPLVNPEGSFSLPAG